jgi:hypothetical protein
MRPGQKLGKRAPRFESSCRICGIQFKAVRRDAQYCGASCRKVASRMKPEIEHLTAAVNRAHATIGPGLFDGIDQETREQEIEQALIALSALWPDLQPWIREMLKRQASKRRLKKTSENTNETREDTPCPPPQLPLP